MLTVYTIDSLDDDLANYATPDGLLTLREAIDAANTNAQVGDAAPGSIDEADAIHFDPALFSDGGNPTPRTITLDGAQLTIADDLRIEGPGEDLLALDGDQRSRIFAVNAGASGELSELTITGGRVGGRTSGGGVLSEGTLTIESCTLANNVAGDDGGGLCVASGEATITNSMFVRNSTLEDDGGGLYLEFGIASVTNCKFLGNLAASSGGGMYIKAYPHAPPPILTLTNSALVGNSAGGAGGGGIYNVNGIVTVTSCTITGNFARRSSGMRGIAIAEVSNSIIALNGPDYGEEGAFSTWLGAASLYQVDPQFVRNPSPGPDETWGTIDDDYGDLRLTHASLAVDGGSTALAVDGSGGPLVTDLNGAPRIVNGTVDIGAYEYQSDFPEGRETPSTVVTSLADKFDAFDGVVTLREACFYAVLGPTPSVVSFSSSILSAGPSRITLHQGELDLYGNVTIAGPGADLLTVDAAGHSRVFCVNGDGAYAVLDGLKITGGSASAGGGICVYRGNLEAKNCEISGNSADGDGGGIWLSKGSLDVTNSIVVGNSAGDSGGGVYSYVAEWNLTNSTIAGNFAAVSGGGISGYRRTIDNSIVALNTANSSSDDLSGSWMGSTSLLGVDPGFVRNPSPGPDEMWGTNDDDLGDLRLTGTSLAINAGSNARAVDAEGSALQFDLDGAPRIYGERVDVGAYEHQAPSLPSGRETPSSVVGDLSDVVDYYDGVVTLREAISYRSLELTTSAITFDPALFTNGGNPAAKTITLNGQALVITDDLEIRGPGSQLLTIDADGKSGAFYFSQSAAAGIEGLAITGGYLEAPGASTIVNAGTLRVANCTLFGNAANYGGAIHNSGTLTVADSKFLDNSSEYDGGGIYNKGALTVTASTLSRNHAARSGGAIHGSAILAGCTFSNNAAGGDGGGVCYPGRLTNCTFIGNSAGGNGGGVEGSGNLTYCTFFGNSAGGLGGGFFGNDVTLASCTFAGNSAKNGGGIAVDSYRGTTTITNCTVAGNSAEGSGGGIVRQRTNPYRIKHLNNSIVALNNASSSNDVSGESFEDPFLPGLPGDPILPGLAVLRLWPDAWSSETANLVGVDPGFVRNPSDGGDGWGDDPNTPDVDESANDDYGDLRLAADSPAIDAGDSSLAVDAQGIPLWTDLADNRRIAGAAVDIGAYEFASTPYSLSTAWDGQGDGQWTDAARWTEGLPGPTTDATVNGGSVTIGGVAATNDLTFGSTGAARLGPQGRLLVSGDLTASSSSQAAVEFSGADNGRVVVSGTAAPGGRIELKAVASLDSIGYHTRTVLEANGGLAGLPSGMPAVGDPLGHGAFLTGASFDDSDADGTPDQVNLQLLQAAPGDQNGDGQFNFDDVFRAFAEGGAKYETGQAATWNEGDFDHDGDFDFDDVFHAFKESGAHYGAGPYVQPPAASQAPAAASSLGDLAWFYALEQSGDSDQGPEEQQSTVDRLLATWP